MAFARPPPNVDRDRVDRVDFASVWNVCSVCCVLHLLGLLADCSFLGLCLLSDCILVVCDSMHGGLG